MGKRAAFEIIYDPRVKKHLRAIEARYHSIIRQAIEQQLTFQAEERSRNRKPLVRDVDFDATWELRFGPDNRFRVFYAVEPGAKVVQVLAIGVKRGSHLSIGGEEISL